MANNGVITIRFEEGSRKVPGPEPINDKQDVVNDKNDNILQTAVITSLLQRGGRQIKGTVVNEAKYQLNKYYQMNDNQLGQQNMNIALNVINKTSDFALNIFTGAKIGSAAGPVGAVVGAVVGLVTSSFGLLTSINHNYEQERIRINQMNANLQFNRQRAGYSLTAGSIGENR